MSETKKIGILFGIENSFPSALVESVNNRNISGIEAEFVQVGAVALDQLPGYAVLLDRISHEIPFYRAFLKYAAINGATVLNNPFWSSADDKFVNYTLAARLGVAVPPTVLLPHKLPPGLTTDRSLRNLEYPLDWDAVFASTGEHGFLKPIHGGGWRDVREVHNRDEFFQAYDESRDLCMIFQKAVHYTDYFRCYVIGQSNVRIMAYDPRLPHEERYVATPRPIAKKLARRIEQDAVKLCQTLGYQMNTVEFAVENGIPYAIDFMNPVPDADIHSVGQNHFDWIVNAVADLAIQKAKEAPLDPELTSYALLTAHPAAPQAAKPAASKAAQPEKNESAAKKPAAQTPLAKKKVGSKKAVTGKKTLAVATT